MVHGANTDITEAWSAFWRSPGVGIQCVNGAPQIVQALRIHWLAFAASLPPNAHVLDIGCGAGAAACALVTARRDIRVVGVDSAQVPRASDPRIRLLSHTAMEALPFADGTFDAAISQFGYEYCDAQAAAPELARVLVSDARFSFVTHHSESSILTANRARLNALVALQQQQIRAVFLSGDAVALDAEMESLKRKHPTDRLVAELARILPLRLRTSGTDKNGLWDEIETALTPEHRILEALDARCVTPEALTGWLTPLRRHGALAIASTLRKPSGQTLAWRIDGEIAPSDHRKRQADSALESWRASA